MPLTSTGIAYDRRDGVTPPVLLLHAGVTDRTMWEPQWAALGGGPGLLRLDLRGFGQSTAAPDGALAHPRDVLSTLDELGVERAHLVGASFGAGVAVETALVAPDRVASLVLCPPGGSLLDDGDESLRRFVAAEDAALAADDLAAAVEANVRTWVVGTGRGIEDVDPRVVEHVRLGQRRAFRAADELGDVEEEELDPPALARLGEVGAPTLVLVGGHDLDATHATADRVARDIPRATLVRWADVAHLPSLERPERFTSLLRDHLAQVAGPLP